MRRIRKLVGLSRDERRLLVRALIEVLVMRIATSTLLYGRVRAIVARRGAERAAATEEIPERDRIAWAVVVASAYVPGGQNCLVRALAAEIVLRRFGYDGELRIGIDRTPGGQFRAHAWLESAGHPVIGDFELDNYVTLSAPGASTHQPRNI